MCSLGWGRVLVLLLRWLLLSGLRSASHHLPLNLLQAKHLWSSRLLLLWLQLFRHVHPVHLRLDLLERLDRPGGRRARGGSVARRSGVWLSHCRLVPFHTGGTGALTGATSSTPHGGLLLLRCRRLLALGLTPQVLHRSRWHIHPCRGGLRPRSRLR